MGGIMSWGRWFKLEFLKFEWVLEFFGGLLICRLLYCFLEFVLVGVKQELRIGIFNNILGDIILRIIGLSRWCLVLVVY